MQAAEGWKQENSQGTPKLKDVVLLSFTSSLHGGHICIFKALNTLTIIQANDDGSGKGRIRVALKSKEFH